MGKRGPPTTDPKVLQLRGTWRGDRHARVPPRIEAPGDLTARPPAWFTAAMAATWRRLLAGVPPRLLGAIDYDLVVVLVEAVDRHGRAARALQEAEAATATAETIAHLTKMVRQAGADVRQTTQVLGLAPAARARVALPDNRAAGHHPEGFVRIA